MAVQDEVPKSRLTLRYRTEINGQPEDVNLPLRLMVLGDFSGETSTDRKVDPDKAEEIEANLPIKSMKSFSPDEIAKNVPKLKALLLLRKLLLEVESNISNSKEFRKVLADLYASEGNFKAVLDQLKGFESFKLPAPQKAAAATWDAPAFRTVAIRATS